MQVVSVCKKNVKVEQFSKLLLITYPIEFETNDTTEIYRSVSYLELRLEKGSKGEFKKTKQHERQIWIPIVNFPFNVPATPTNQVYISTLIQYSRVYAAYQDFVYRWLLISRKLLKKLKEIIGCH